MAETLACGVNFSAVDFRKCVHKNDGAHTATKGWRYVASGGSYWQQLPWNTGEYAADYTGNRLWRRLLQEGFAVVAPQAWGAQHSPRSWDGWYAFDGDTQDPSGYDPKVTTKQQQTSTD